MSCKKIKFVYDLAIKNGYRLNEMQTGWSETKEVLIMKYYVLKCLHGCHDWYCEKNYTNWNFGLSQKINFSGTLKVSIVHFVYCYVNFICFTKKFLSILTLQAFRIIFSQSTNYPCFQLMFIS